MCWYMRGSIDYNTAHALSPEDRKMISEQIKSNIETVKKTKMPLL